MVEIRKELLDALSSRKRPYSIKNELTTLEYSQEEIERCLSQGIPEDENDYEIRQWRLIFSIWDNAEGSWTENTRPCSKERRNIILGKLEIEGTQLYKSICDNIPLNENKIGPAVISENKDHEDWIQPNRFHQFGYWTRYVQHLKNVKNWNSDAIDSLDKSTTRILNHLIDPMGGELRKTKGLVVGYVQSGKTANYSALIAKAIDVGYQMIIVLSGRTNILRDQTQARLDMEVIGWDGLDEGEKEEYEIISQRDNQNYREKFVSGEIRLPSKPIRRLTKAKMDFDQGSIALKNNGIPSVLVIKKNNSILKKIAKVLGESEWKNKPVLLIDDEADDASINTNNPEKIPTVISALIAKILRASDGSQYVGYTATPYANVFIRPDELEELFPNDFVICLERPNHYMGALEFFDISDCHSEPDGVNTKGNEDAHIRVITETEIQKTGIWDNTPKLDNAIHSFMLAGAIKWWREESHQGKFKHHTMLINTDLLTEKHDDIAREVEGLLEELYPINNLTDTSRKKMIKLWEEDFKPICSYYNRGEPMPASWNEIEPYICKTITRINAEKVKIVNHKNNEDTPDFEIPGGIWAILVGGSKLSRGYTIEGLTTTYFSRKPGQLDTLVQMARWYGYRKGYRDLVRLFIPEFLPRGKSKQNFKKTKVVKKYHLLEAFRFGAMVEESFRTNLFEYSKTLKPEDIPPLVQYEFKDIPHKFTYLKPTAPNKKRYATYKTTYLGGVIRTATRIGGINCRAYNELKLMEYANTCEDGLTDITLRFEGIEEQKAITGSSTSKAYLNFLENVKYSDIDPNHCPKVIEEQKTALNEMPPLPWRIIMFRRQIDPYRVFPGRKHDLPKWTRNYKNPTDGILIYDKPLDPGHKKISAWLAHHPEGLDLNTSDSPTLRLRNLNAGVTYIVPFSRNENPEDMFFLWCAIYPGRGSAGVYQVIHHTAAGKVVYQ